MRLSECFTLTELNFTSYRRFICRYQKQRRAHAMSMRRCAFLCYSALFVARLVHATANDLSFFTDAPIRVFLSAAEHVYLGRDMRSEDVVARSKYADIEGFVATVRLTADAGGYRLEIGEETVCPSKNAIKTCATPARWEIEAQPLGFTIGTDKRCLTIVKRGTVQLAPCTATDDQLFDFRLANEDSACAKESPLPPARNTPAAPSIFLLSHSHSHPHPHRHRHRRSRHGSRRPDILASPLTDIKFTDSQVNRELSDLLAHSHHHR